MTRRHVAPGDPMAALLHVIDQPVLDVEALGRGLLRLPAMDQVLLGGALMRLGRNGDRYLIADLGAAIACRGARRLSTHHHPDLTPTTEEDR